jgi:hypothetical protein
LSLISEGLKKAHLETLRQDRENRRQYFGPGRTDVPSGRSSRVVLFGAAMLGAVLAAAGTAVWITGAREDTQAALSADHSGNASGAITAGTIDSQPMGPVTVTEGTVVEPQPRADALPERLATREAAPPTPGIPAAMIPAPRNTADPERTADVEQSPAVVEPPVAKRESPVRAGPKRRDGLVDGESYASPVRSPGGGEVRLSGISSSKGQALAIINGSVVREGDEVGSFVVEKIERGRVQLRYADVRFWLGY